MTIAPAVAADVPGVVALIGRVYGEYGFVWDPVVEVPDLFAFDAHYTAPRGAFFVIRESGLVVGSVGVERLPGRRAELHRLYLDAELRGRGHGRALVDTVVAWSRDRDVDHLELWSDTRFVDAHRLYVRMGFVHTGERTIPDDVNDTREYHFERGV